MAEIDAEAFADNAVLIGLVTHSQLRQARAEAEDGTVGAISRALMRKGFLTSWQRDRLVKGDTTGFFFGDTKVLFHLAEGTFARVYRGRKGPGGSPVAVKVLRRRFTMDKEAVVRFNQEAEAGMRLVHPNIVRIHEFGEHDKNYYMIMEYVEGSNLRDFLKIRQRLSPVEAIPLMIGLAKGLQYSFDNGVTHRDIKATNILIGSKGDAKLVDYGLATINLDDFTAEAQHGLRTVDYSALERSCGSPKGDPRSDIYFLGCVFYQMLTGAAAMSETETSDQLAKMLKRSFSAIKPLSEHRLAPDPELSKIIEKMMRVDLRTRYGDMDHVVNDLLNYQDSHELGKEQAIEAAKTDNGSGQGASILVKKEAPKHVTGSIEDLFQQAFGTELDRTRQILCVEAQEAIQDVFRKALSRLGYKVMIVRDAERAAERYRESPPDAVIFDADGLGPQALQSYLDMHAKAHEDGQDLKAVVLLGPRQGELTKRLPKDHRLVVLHKPIKMKDVQDALEKLFSTD
jgi:tRNA A-37 threonylcarbamoyl transferase component Bud32/CheY-like chemotaxis protein